MKPGLLALTPGQAAQFVGSDGLLQIDVPAGAIIAADLKQAGGSINLKVTQIAPASGSNAGSSGHVSFGTYLAQLVNGAGQLVPQGLRQPALLTLHYGQVKALDMSHAVVTFNTALPSGSAWRPSRPPPCLPGLPPVSSSWGHPRPARRPSIAPSMRFPSRRH